MTQNLYPNLMFGGTGGSPFDDVTAAHGIIVGIRSMTISWSSSQVESIITSYLLSDGSEFRSDQHGHDGGVTDDLFFTDDETIIAVEGRSGNRVDQIKFIIRNSRTNEIKVWGPVGGNGGSPFVVNGMVGGFFGRSRTTAPLDAIGFYLTSPSSKQYGGIGGTVFSDPMLTQNPPVVGIQSITVYAASRVDGIQISYRRSDGTVYAAPRHGSKTNNETTIPFANDEKILAIVGRSQDRIDQLNFLTTTELGVRKTYGPYGGTGGNPFILNAEALGIFGRSGTEVDALGFYTADVLTDGLTVYGGDGYIYCVLESTQETNICRIPVGNTATDLSYRLQYLDSDDAGGVGFTVVAPDGTSYFTPSNGIDGVWATSAAESGLGLQTFYISNPMPGTWTATISSAYETSWSIIGSTNSADATEIARGAFAQLGPPDREALFNAIAPTGTEIPPEFCYFCQAQAVAIMGVAVATFILLAGVVTPTSAAVLYARNLLGGTAESWVRTFESLYSAWSTGTSSWNLARRLCEFEGSCPRDPQ